MKTRFFILFCAAVMMAACCGRNSQSSEKTCCKEAAKTDVKACCKEAAKTDGKACCKEAGKTDGKTCCMEAGKTDVKACCKEAGKTDGKACCLSAAEVKKLISAQVFIKPEKVDAFINATKDLIEKSRAEAGCISYSLFQDPQDKTKFLFFEEWKNQTAVDVHFATEHFIKFGDVLNDCSAKPAIITVFDTMAEKKL